MTNPVNASSADGSTSVILGTEADRVYVELPPFFLNQSRWKVFQDCGRLYGWQEIANLEPARPRKPLEIGAAIHKAMVQAHKEGATTGSFEHATKLAVDIYEKSMDRGPKLMGDDAEIKDGADVIKRMLPAYHRHWAAKGELWKPLGMELKFCVEVGEGTNVWLVGTIDNLVTFMNNLWLVDYKTMGNNDSRNFLKYEIDIQLTAYIYGGTKQLSLDSIAKGGKPVVIRGAIIDGLVKTLVPDFPRELFTRSIEDLREFEKEFCMKAWEIASKHAMIEGKRDVYDALCNKMYELGAATDWKTILPKNTNRCFQYGTCSFRELCVADTETRRLLYRPRHFDYVDRARLKASGEYREWMDPEVIAAHPATDVCTSPKPCFTCAVRDCPQDDPQHYHQDGCPSCALKQPEKDALS